jgi:putative membrane protein
MRLMRVMVVTLGLAAFAGAWLGPLPAMAAQSFWAHMTRHMLVVAVGAPLLACGIAGSKWDPTRAHPSLLAPIPASLVELVVVWTWHAPVLHHLARQEPWALVLEQGSFAAAGLWLWIAAVSGPLRDRSTHNGAGVLGLLLTSMHMTLLGALLALAQRPLYAHDGAGHAANGLSALADQHLGGAIMLVAGSTSYLAGGLWLTANLLRRATRSERTT